jgi:hypothetical protein
MSIHKKLEQFETLASTQEFLKWVPDNCKENILHVLWEDISSESIESMDEIPELESENYKIDTHLSVEDKLNSWWTKDTDWRWISYLHKDLWWWGEIREYLAWVDKDYIWKQKFNRVAVEQLWLKDKLPKNYEEFKKIWWIKHIYFMLKYFSNNDRFILDGSFDSDRKIFYGIDILENYWVWTGYSIELTKDGIGTRYSCCNPKFGMSVRLVKGR